MKIQSPHTNPYTRGLSPSQCKHHYRRLQTADSTASQQGLLMSLPPELRNQIYELVLVQDTVLRKASNKPKKVTRAAIEKAKQQRPIWTTSFKEPALQKSCRQIRNEVIQTYYGRNTFVCRHSRRLAHWLKKLGNERQRMLRDVQVRFKMYGGDGRRDEEQGLLAFELERFTEEISRPMSGITISNDIIRGWRRRRDRRIVALTLSEIKAAFTSRQRQVYNASKRNMKRYSQKPLLKGVRSSS